jgi:carbon monoxide dehydrogenase subunit G
MMYLRSIASLGCAVLLSLSTLSAWCMPPMTGGFELEIQSAQLRPCNRSVTNDCVKVDVKLSIEAPVETVWQVITDYQNAASFISNLKSSTQTATGPNSLLVTQVGKVGWHYLNVEIKTIYQVSLNPTDKTIKNVAVGGDLKTVNMFTQLTPKANGGSVLTYTLVTDPGPWAPLPLTEELLKRQAHQGFTDLSREIVRRASVTMPVKP